MRARTRTLVVPFTLSFFSLAASLTGPPDALADSSADEADARFHRGNQLFKAGQYDEALVEFFTSNRLAHNRNVIFNIARSYEALGRFEEAYRYYAEYIAEEPNKDERSAAQRRLKELEPRVALLRIDSNPPGATVYLERKDLGGRGETPLLMAVPPGRHKVLIEARGYRPGVEMVEAVRGRPIDVSSTLELIVGRLVIASRPRAMVYIDRAAGTAAPPAANTTPATLQLTPGRHTVELEAPGYRIVRSDVVIKASAATRLDMALEEKAAPSGTVVLASETPGALVMVDGIERGFTPAVLSLSIGGHDVVVRGEGYQVWRRKVDVSKDGRAFYQVELAEEEPEVTGASRVQQTLSQAPASVSIITRDEIWSLGYQSLTDAVRGVRGIYTSDDRNYEAIGVRGFSRPGDLTNRVLLTRDGHAMNDDAFGSAAVGRDFAADLDDVQRIEIVRGPGSTFYGPSAFFGVIQVVSEEPGRGAPVRAGGYLASDGGGLAFARGSAGGGRAAVSVYASAYESAGQNFHFDEFVNESPTGDVDDADGENAQRGGLRARVGDFSLDASLARRRKDVPTAPFGTVFGEASQTTDRRGYAEGRWEHKRGPLGIIARAAYDHQQYDGVYPYPPEEGAGLFRFTDEGGGNWATGELRLSLEGMSQKFTLGAEVADHHVLHGYDETEDGENEFQDKRRFTNGSVYGVEEVSLLEDALRLSAGVRFDWFGDQSDNAISPRVALIVRPYEDGYTKLIAGRAFRSPSPYELYYNDGGLTQIAAGELDPETIWTGEVEHTHNFGPRSFLIGSAFASQISDIVNLEATDDDAMLLVFQNSPNEVRALGGELEARYAFRTGAWCGAAASYTWLNSDDDAIEVNSSAAVGSVRGFIPLMGERLGLASEIIYNAPRPRRDGNDTPSMVLGRLFLSGRLRSAGLLYRAGITNLLDWDYSVPVGEELVQQQIVQPERAFHAQLIYEIN
ncbi:MAG TPA: TonB-dependent receptor [Kofleriaceae bacterium]|nr:TonB-dependent receptor [Kofleriaceae bacterium]